MEFLFQFLFNDLIDLAQFIQGRKRGIVRESRRGMKEASRDGDEGDTQHNNKHQ